MGFHLLVHQPYKYSRIICSPPHVDGTRNTTPHGGHVQVTVASPIWVRHIASSARFILCSSVTPYWNSQNSMSSDFSPWQRSIGPVKRLDQTNQRDSHWLDSEASESPTKSEFGSALNGPRLKHSERALRFETSVENVKQCEPCGV